MKNLAKRMLRPLADALARREPVAWLVRRELGRLASEPFSAALIDDFIHGNYGAPYDLDAAARARLVERFREVNSQVESGTSPLVHVVLAREILSLPPDTVGDIVECGTWKGASSASLSIVCGMTGRRLLVCDSFEGLPDDGEVMHTGLHVKRYGRYQKGMFAGALEEVRENIRRCGNLDACQFVQGFFAESLRALHDPVAFAFLDVDLARSTRECLRHLWPLLIEGGAIYSDDAGDLDVISVYFDTPWWRDTLGIPAPGFVGSGCGLPLNPHASAIGYTRKMTQFNPQGWSRAPYLHYRDGD
jgi:hypothetical protein